MNRHKIRKKKRTRTQITRINVFLEEVLVVVVVVVNVVFFYFTLGMI